MFQELLMYYSILSNISMSCALGRPRGGPQRALRRPLGGPSSGPFQAVLSIALQINSCIIGTHSSVKEISFPYISMLGTFWEIFFREFLGNMFGDIFWDISPKYPSKIK